MLLNNHFLYLSYYIGL